METFLAAFSSEISFAIIMDAKSELCFSPAAALRLYSEDKYSTRPRK